MLEGSSKEKTIMQKTNQDFVPILRIALAVLFVLFAYFFSQIISGMVVYIVLAVGGGSQAEISSQLQDSTFSQFAFLGVAMAVELGLFYGLSRITKLNLSYLNPNKFSLSKSWIIPVALASYMVASSGLMGLLSGAIDTDQKQQIGFENVHGGLELAMVFGALVILTPLAEEILFRGFLYTEFRKKINLAVSSIIVSAFFAGFHLQLGSGHPPLWSGFVDTFVLSLVLCFVREKTGSIWYGVAIHSLKNFLAFLLIFVLHINI